MDLRVAPDSLVENDVRGLRSTMSRSAAAASRSGDAVRRRADIGSWVSSARKKIRQTNGVCGGLVLPDYLEAFEVDAYHVSGGTDYGFDMGYTISSTFYERDDYAAFAARENFFSVVLVYQTPDGYPMRKVVSSNRSLQAGHGNQPLGVVSASTAFSGMGVMGQEVVLPYRIELVGLETQMAFSRTANEGAYSHTVTLSAYFPPTISAALPVPNYAYGTSPVDKGIHDKKIDITITAGDFPAPDNNVASHTYNIILEIQLESLGYFYTQSDKERLLGTGIPGTSLSTFSGTFLNLYPEYATQTYRPIRLRYKVVSGAYSKQSTETVPFCFPPKLIPDKSLASGIAVGFDYDTLKFTSHKLRVSSYDADGDDRLHTVKMEVRYNKKTGSGLNPATLEFNGDISPTDFDYVTSTATSTTGIDALTEGSTIAQTSGQVDMLFSIVPTAWHAFCGGTNLDTLKATPAGELSKKGFRIDWLDFASSKQTVLTMPSCTAFNTDWELWQKATGNWEIYVESFTVSNWPAGNHSDFRVGIQPYRHSSADGTLIDFYIVDQELNLRIFANKDIVWLYDTRIELLAAPPRNYHMQYLGLNINTDTYHFEWVGYTGGSVINPDRVLYTAPQVNSITVDTVPLATNPSSGYQVRLTAFDGFTGSFTAGEKATYDIDIYVSVYGSATTPAECEVGPVSGSFDPSDSLSTPLVLYTFDRTATTPYKWGSSYVTNGEAQTHKVFVVVGYTPNPAHGEPIESMSKIDGLHTASVSGVAVPAIPIPSVLDSYAGTVLPSLNGAYSPRRLFSAYTGPTMKIRRDTDNREGEVSVDGSGNISAVYDLTTTTYSPFATWTAGATYIEPVTVYDQSGNGNHATLASGTPRSATNFMRFDPTAMTLTAGDATGAGTHYYDLPEDTVPIGDVSYTLLAHHGDLYHPYSQFVSGGQTNLRMWNGLSRGSPTQYVNNWWSDDVGGGTVVTTGAVVAAVYDHVNSQRKIWTPANGNGTWVAAANDRVTGSRVSYLGRQGTQFMRCQLKTVLIANTVLSDADVAGIRVALEAYDPLTPSSHFAFEGDLANTGANSEATVFVYDDNNDMVLSVTGDVWFGTAATKKRIKLPGNTTTVTGEIATPYLGISYPGTGSGSSARLRELRFWERFNSTPYSATPVENAFSIVVTFKTSASSGVGFTAWQPSKIADGNTLRTGGYFYIYNNRLNALMYRGIDTILLGGNALLTDPSYNTIDTTNTHQIAMTFRKISRVSPSPPDMVRDYYLKAYFDGQLRIDSVLTGSIYDVNSDNNDSNRYYCNRMGSAGKVTSTGGCEVYDYRFYERALSDAEVATLYAGIDAPHT